jgi:hypothetical protein
VAFGGFQVGPFQTNYQQGAAVLADSPANFWLIAPPSMPGLSEFTPLDLRVDRDFNVLARMASVQSYLEDVEQWMNDELGTDEELVNVFEDDSFKVDGDLFGNAAPRRGRKK